MTPARPTRSLVVLLIGTLMALLRSASAAEPPDVARLDRTFDGSVRPVLARYCITCHSAAKHKGELNLEVHADAAAYRQDAELLEKIADQLDHGEMPPKESPQLTAEARQALRRWITDSLDAGAAANAGDPGPVVMRRLTNVEYTNAVRDLAGIDLDPAREFPVDAAAGEGFTNVSDALVMSPALIDKYMDAAKGIAAHVVLLPDGFRFSEKSTRPDWTEEILDRIKGIYRRYTDPRGAEKIQLQGLTWESKGGGQIPLESYLAAALAGRDGATARPLASFAQGHQLSTKYLATLRGTLDRPSSSLLLDELHRRWGKATPADIPALAAWIRGWQGALTQFRSVGHFKPWQVTVNPIVESQAFRLKLIPAKGASEIVLRLAAGDAGDGAQGDLVEWQAPRLEAPGRPTILLRDLPATLDVLEAKRRLLKDTTRYLALADELRSAVLAGDGRALASARGLDPDLMAAWLDLLGIAGSGSPVPPLALFTNRMDPFGEYQFVSGWGSPQTPNVVANASDQEVLIPGILKPHSVVVHPSPTQNVAVAWKSPLVGAARVEARVAHSHPDCGNGISWVLERRRNAERRRLQGGTIEPGQEPKIAPLESVMLQPGDLLCLVVGPRDDYACDLTRVDLTVQELAGPRRRWNLAGDVSGKLAASNPHADSLGGRDTWSFFEEKVTHSDVLDDIPDGSVLDLWREASNAEERARLANQLQELLREGAAPASRPDDQTLVRRLRSPSGPLLGRIDTAAILAKRAGCSGETGLLVQAPKVVEYRLPAEFVAGREFAVTAALDGKQGVEGTVQVQVLADAAPAAGPLVAGPPILVGRGGHVRKRIEAAFDDFRKLLPAALCYSQVVPVDEVVTLALYHREDENLARLMLDDDERKMLDRLWDELEYVSQEALKVEVGYVQFMEYTTQDSDPNLFKPLAKPIKDKAQSLRQRLKDTEPRQLDELERLARRAYRRPRTESETAELRQLYGKLRSQGLDHDAAFRLTLARVLIAPAFLYQVELPASGNSPQPVSPWELASRLSFFLWSSPPDEELYSLAAQGTLSDPAVLTAQMKRMLADPRARNLATEFACQWLDIRGFDRHNEKSEQTFPEFAALRGAMYEEAVLFFMDLFRTNGSLLEVLDTDHTYLNEALAKHYGVPGVAGPNWRRVDGIRAQSRGGVLGMAALLSKQSGASRTSPILRGNWLLEMLLGEKLPRPPKNVPQLPESERDTGGLTMRQITEKHRADASCAKCHVKIDPFGFALEGFDAIGRRRDTDLGGRPIDTKVSLPDGTTFTDLPGLRSYLLEKRRDEFVRHFARKLLGFALGRGVQLSDRPLLETIQKDLTADGYRVQHALITVLQSPQFRLRRGLEAN